MTYFLDNFPYGVNLESLAVAQLLRLVADQDKGCRGAALDRLMSIGIEPLSPELEVALRNDGDADLRNGAMEVLVAFGAAAIPRLVAFLRDDNEEVRNFSAVMLGNIGSREAVNPLIEALRDADVNVQHAAAEALGVIGDRAALVPLLALLKGDFWQQYPAVSALGAMRDERAVPYLLPLLREGVLAQPAMEALGKIGDPRALMPLMAIIGSPETADCAPAVRAVVAIIARTMERSEEGCCRQLSRRLTSQGLTNLLCMLRQSQDRESVIAAVTLLGWRADADALPELLRLLEQDGYIEVVERAILALGPEVLPQLREVLAEPFMDVRIVALRVLRWMGGISDLGILLPMLKDGPAVQREVVAALVGSSDERFFAPLCQLAMGGDSQVRDVALVVVAGYPAERSALLLEELAGAVDAESRRSGALLAGAMEHGSDQVLLRLLRDSSADVRRAALRGVGERCLAAAVPLVWQALADDHHEVREEAVRALAAYRDPLFLPELLQLIGSGEERLDQVVAMAAGVIGSPLAASQLIKLLCRPGNSGALVYTVIDSLGRLGPLAESERQAIRACTNHEDADIRRLAVTTLARLEGVQSLPLLEAACSDRHWSVRVAAAEALAEIDRPESRAFLLALLEDTDHLVRNHAADFLARRGESAAVLPLARLLSDHESGKAAFEALLTLGEAALPFLHPLLGEQQSGVSRERVVDLLGRIASPFSVAALLPALDDADPAVRLAAIDSLVSCFDRLLLARLPRMVLADPDPEVRLRAELVLKVIGAESC